VPLADLRRLVAAERLAPAEVVEAAEVESTPAAHREWVAAGLAQGPMSWRWQSCSSNRED
jgi:hypothetical protein